MATIEWHRILQTDSIQRMAELIRRELNLWVGFLTIDGQHTWIGTAQRTDKPLCDAFMIRNDAQTCIANYREWIGEISPSAPVSLFMQCHAGMQGIIVPIVYNAECVAAFFASGFVFADADDPDSAILERGDFLHINRATLAHGCRELVRLTRRESQLLRNFLEEMAVYTARCLEQFEASEQRSHDPIMWGAASAPFASFIGRSTIMQSVVDQAKHASCSQSPILITGEPGTGKTRLAQAIREASYRRTSPYVVMNCDGNDVESLESELFGHKRGTSANAFIDKLGLLDIADKGTLLVKNVDAMPLCTQTKLAQVIENGCFLPLGDVVLHRVDVRIIATTTRNLDSLVEAGEFSRDLCEKLCVVPIHIPALMAHAEDIADLCQYYIAIKCKACKRQPKTIANDALVVLGKYLWPGNVRELENEIERIVVLSGSSPIIGIDDIAPRIRSATQSIVPPHAHAISPEQLLARYKSLADMIDAVEHEIIATALAQNNENRTQTAKLLKISRRHLVRKLEGYRKRDS